MTEVKFYDTVADERLKFAVILAMHDGQWVLCRHRDRNTWEIPGGHREPNEDIAETARRELIEETGALHYTLWPVCAYSVTAPDNFDGQETFGMLYFAQIAAFSDGLHHEIQELLFTHTLPDRLTYPAIQPRLLQEAQRRGWGVAMG